MPTLINDDPEIVALREANWRAVVAANPRVTMRNHLADPVWYFDSAIPWKGRQGKGKALAIYWPTDLPGDMSDLFRYLGFLLFVSRTGEVRLAAAGAPPFSAAMRRLASFMRRHECVDFGDLDEATFQAFEKELRTGILREVRDLDGGVPAEWMRLVDAPTGEDGAADGDDELGRMTDGDDAAAPADPAGMDGATDPGAHAVGGAGTDDVDAGGREVEDAAAARQGAKRRRATLSVAFASLVIWSQVRRLESSLRRAGLRPMPFNPFEKANAMVAARKISNEVEKPIDPIPDGVALAILEPSLAILDKAEEAIALHDAWSVAFDDPDLGPAEACRLVSEARFSTYVPGGPPWHAPLTPNTQSFGSNRVIAMVKVVRTAALEVLQAFAGVRINETFSPKVGPRARPDLPSSVTIEPSRSGDLELFVMTGTLFKQQLDPVEEKWVIGCRLPGDDEMPPAVRALDVLERLLEPYRSRCADSEVAGTLIVGPRHTGHPPYSHGIVSIQTRQQSVARREFFERHVDLSAHPDLDADGRDIRPYKADLATAAPNAAWRPTFVIFVVRTDSSLKPALSRHFKHLYLATLDAGYIQNRSEILEAARSERLRDTALFLKAIANGEEAAEGLLVDEMRRVRARVATMIDGLDDHDALDRLRLYAGEQDLRMFRSRWSFCIPAWNPEEAACRKSAGTAAWDARTPSFATRSPCVCSGCKVGAMDGRHVPHWRDEHDRWDALAATLEGAARVAARRRRDQAAAVLARFGLRPQAASADGAGSAAA